MLKPNPLQPEVPALRMRLQPAGHILGSAYIELEVSRGTGKPAEKAVVVFSGVLGAPDTPLLPAPANPTRADPINRQGARPLHRLLNAVPKSRSRDSTLVTQALDPNNTQTSQTNSPV